MARMLSRLRTSNGSGSARRPSALISAWNGASVAGSRLVITRSAPARASARPKYWPSPRLVPVTMATLPVRSNGFSLMLILVLAPASRFTFHASRFTLHVPRITA